jgi:hypothetical protein
LSQHEGIFTHRRGRKNNLRIHLYIYNNHRQNFIHSK